ncbi:hypothetical protein GCM10009759_06580 [Kitasatospora saccharophila]|uniref:HEAT repeat protein n=1 Tax=Kitasatospora saccharophila TaxID=407973 RepID=A0ABN2WAI4_9ACTN
MGKRWQDDPAYQAVVRAFIDGDPLEQAGGPLDVRAVLAAFSRERKDAFAYDDLPWERFPRGPETRDDVARLRSADPEQVWRGLHGVSSELADSAWSVAALAVPFLLRVAADPGGHQRARALELAAGVAQWTRRYDGRFPHGPLHLIEDGWCYEPSGYLGTWGIEAARAAIAADADLVTALLDDPDPEVRVAAAYAGAAASGRVGGIRAAPHAHLRVEDDPVAAGLVLAVAQLAVEHPDPGGAAWTRSLWSDPTLPPVVRVSAALGWLHLVDAPAPGDLRAVLDEHATEETARLMAPLPWMRGIDAYNDGAAALRGSLEALLHSEPPEPQRTGTESPPF